MDSTDNQNISACSSYSDIAGDLVTISLLLSVFIETNIQGSSESISINSNYIDVYKEV